jgi:hypothetical protein
MLMMNRYYFSFNLYFKPKLKIYEKIEFSSSSYDFSGCL